MSDRVVELLDSSSQPFVPADYATGEKMFIVLSFTAKTLLAWVAFGGVVATSK